jgi:hypothetical protein
LPRWGYRDSLRFSPQPTQIEDEESQLLPLVNACFETDIGVKDEAKGFHYLITRKVSGLEQEVSDDCR